MALLSTIDWKLLCQQKAALISAIAATHNTQDANLLDGLLSLVDEFQDEAETQGFPVVWLSTAQG